MVGVAEASMVDTATVAVVAAEEAVVAAMDKDMVAAAVAKTKTRIIIMIAISMKPQRVIVHRHLLVEMGTVFLRV